MKQSSISGVNSKKHFQIVLDPEVYSVAERCGYAKAIFEGEEIKGNVEVELAKPEMVKCIRLQLIGFISKNRSVSVSDVLKYVNNPENPGTIPKAMKMFSIDSYSSSSNNKGSSDGNISINIPSKYDNIRILVDYDVILWGIMKASSTSSKDHNSKDYREEYDSRKGLVNHKFVASRLGNERLKLPFTFKLLNISNDASIPLPSSYQNGKCQIEYFLYATIHRPWPSRNSVRLMKLRVLQKIKIDVPKYLEPVELKKVKELKFMKYIKKGLIEMNVKIPQQAYCHRDNIPIEVSVNHLGMNKTIIGFSVGLYEKCFYEDTNLKKFVNYSFKLVSSRYYEYLIKPGESNVYTILNFPIVDGNSSIQRKFLRNSIYSSALSTNVADTSNNGSEESIKEDDGTLEDEDLGEEEIENDITRIQLKDVKVPLISASIDETSRWPIKVVHKLRVVAMTDENINKIIRKMKGDDKSTDTTEDLSPNENEPQNNDYEEYLETDSQVNIHVSPPSSPLAVPNKNSSCVSSEQSINNLHGGSNVSSTKDLINSQNVENQKYISENKKYGVIMGHLSSGDTPSIPRSRKALDFEFDIVIGTMTKTPRIFGKEFKLDDEIEDQFYNAILRKNNMNNKLRIKPGSASSSVSNSINKISQKKDDEPDIRIHTRIRTNSSSNDSYSEYGTNQKDEINPPRQRLSPIPSASVLPNSNLNKDLPTLPTKENSNDEGRIAVLPQHPPTLPPRNATSSLSSPSYPPPSYPSQTPYEQMFPNIPQFSNPQEFVPTAPTLDDLETPPPPYEFSENTNPTYQNEKH